MERTSSQGLNASKQACARGVEGLREILESFQTFNDLSREGLEIFENSFIERRDQLQLSVQTLEASSALGVSELEGAKVERFHRREVIAST